LFPLLKIENLTIDFPGSESAKPALEDFSLELAQGELLAVVGESGSGKSVMSLAIMNLLSPAARIVKGSILFSPDGVNQTDLLGIPEDKIRKFRGNILSMIFQEPMTSLNPVMTCGAQLIEPLMLHKKLSRAKARSAALSLFEKVKIQDPEMVYRRYPHQLSGGQKQRVMIAMAISCRPALLICDEPTTALDVRVQKTILELLKDIRRAENMGMIFITHDLGLVSDLADRVLVMLSGRMVEQGFVKDLFQNPKHPYTRALLMSRPVLHLKGHRLPIVADFLKNDEPIIFKQDDLFEIQSEPRENSKPGRSISREKLIVIKGLDIRYSSGKNWMGREKRWLEIIKDVNFEVYKGETLGVVGESGSGKTTLGRALLALNKPVRGSITYEGMELLTMPKNVLINFRSNIQIVFQDPYSSLNPRLMAGPAISEPLKVHSSLTISDRKEYVMELLQKVGLSQEHYYRYPHAFSGGQRQRIVIARALSLNPGFVVFDESVSALDVSVQAQVLNLINDLKEKLGFTVVFISHDLSVIRYLCDRVIVLEKGKIVESGEVESVFLNPRTTYTRSLIEAIPGRGLW
jgi:peptide/nickel transport system ATP-binding protein